jgi:GAF domain-containing protein
MATMDNNTQSPQLANSVDYQSQRETLLSSILRVTCILGVVAIAIPFSTATLASRTLFIALYLILLAITFLKTTYTTRAFTLLAILFIVGVNTVFLWGPWLDGSVFFMSIIVLSALLFDRHVDIIMLVISILTFVVIAVLQQIGLHQLSLSQADNTSVLDWSGYVLDFIIPSTIIIIIINQLKKAFARIAQDMQETFQTLLDERARLESRVFERTGELASRAAQLHSSASISRTIAEIQDISELMETTTRLTAEQFGYYHVGLYLLDERKKNAFLQTSSSDEGNRFIGQGFRIEPNRLNLFYRVIENKRPYTTSDIEGVGFAHDEKFPRTRSRMALPLTVRNDVIGILDIHAEQPNSITMQDAEVLQTLADLVAISLDNVRLINETKNLLQQLEVSTSVQARETWSKFTSRHKPAYQYTPAGIRPIFTSNKHDDQDGLQIPLVLQGQKIGNITLKRKGSAMTWSDRERNLVKKVADQVALAVENSRLVDETQKSALRDQVIANISARVRETLDVESVLRTAATELRRVFDLKEAEISIGDLHIEGSPSRKNTGILRLR